MDNDERWRRWKRQKNIGITAGIILFIVGILLILFGSPDEVHHIGNLCSIAGLFLTIVYIMADTSREEMREEFKETREGLQGMREGFQRMDKRFTQIITEMDKRFAQMINEIKKLPKEIAKEIKK